MNKYWLGLSFLDPLPPFTTKKLLDYFKTPECIWKVPQKHLNEALPFKEKSVEFIVSQRKKLNLDKELEKLYKLDIDMVTIEDENYPYLLKHTSSPPLVVFIKGKYIKEDVLAIAVVGTRRCTTYGRITAKGLSSGIASLGFTIVSGLAYGIDTIAHEAALNQESRTIAVLGTGLDTIYPKENQLMSEKIIEQGALISEFPLGTLPHKYNFPRRNRIISGLSLGVLVVEGGIKSGAMITAHFALEQGREVFAIPGAINREKSEGPNSLIKEGAKIVTRIEDLLEELPFWAKKVEKKKRDNIPDRYREIIDFLKDDPKTIDQISSRFNIGLSELSFLLIDLESKKEVESVGGGKFACFTNDT